MNQENNLISSTLKQARKKANCTYSAIADRLIYEGTEPKITISLLSRYERGHVLPSLKRYKNIMRVLGVESVSEEIFNYYRTAIKNNPSLGQLGPGIRGENDYNNAVEFVRTWQKSSGVKDVADKLNMTITQASSKATAYRKKGVPLKRMPRGNKKTRSYDWDHLAKIAEESFSD